VAAKPTIDCLVTNAYTGTSSIEGDLMKTVEARKVKVSEKLLAESEKSHEPIHIVGKKNAGVLISMDDWRAIQETLYLLSIPKMREWLVRGLKTPVDKCSPELSW
jgi:PHD/YefM family antitoxin component YafN of YafNO toxin-antitoxin module